MSDQPVMMPVSSVPDSNSVVSSAVVPNLTAVPPESTIPFKSLMPLLKIIFAVVSIVLFVIAISLGVSLSRKNNTNKVSIENSAGINSQASDQVTNLMVTAAPSTSQVVNTTAESPSSNVVTSAASSAPVTANLATVNGAICRNIVQFPGILYTYNIVSKQIRIITLTRNEFVLSLPIGDTMFLYEPNSSKTNIGYTDASHRLLAITLSATTPITHLQLCDTQVDQTSIPNTYAMVK